jgi:hypothetical protein
MPYSFRYLFMPAALGLCLLSGPALGQSGGVSVALSDNLIVLDSRSRSGAIELVNLASDPTEFTLSVLSVKDTQLDGESLIRWAPRRTLAPANRTAPFRVSARPPGDLPPGEYLIRVGVTARVQSPPPVPQEFENAEGEMEMGLSAVVPIVPTLPVTVYYRHGIETPTINAGSLVLTPDNITTMGYFPVTKPEPKYSFVGAVQVIEQNSGTIINQGRLHLAQGVSASNVNMPRGERAMLANGVYCLRIWHNWPAEGAPNQEVCS